MPWNPSYSEAFVAAAREAITATLAELPNINVQDGSLARGCAGCSLLYFYAAREFNDEQLLSTSRQYAAAAFEAIEQHTSASLFYGCTGIAFVLQHTRVEEGCELLVDFDSILLERLSAPSWSGDYELLVGLAGVGVYALERYAQTNDGALLRQVIHLQCEYAERSATGSAWLTPPEYLDSSRPHGTYNLGMAHGVPSALAFLSRCLLLGLEAERIRPLLARATSWLLAQERPSGFPWEVLPDGTASEIAPPLWGYGDPGIALSLLLTARALQDDGLAQTTKRIARRGASAQPSPAPSTNILQGAAGAALANLRLYHHFKEDAFRDVAGAWLAELLASRVVGSGVGGFLPKVVPAGDMLDEVGLLTGAVGIALTLLAAISDAPPDWDRLLLLS